MPTTTMPVSEVRCACGATALRCNYHRFGWLRHESAPLDKLGRRRVTFTCQACRQLSPADSGAHSRGKSSRATGTPRSVRAGAATTAGEPISAEFQEKHQ